MSILSRGVKRVAARAAVLALIAAAGCNGADYRIRAASYETVQPFADTAAPATSVEPLPDAPPVAAVPESVRRFEAAAADARTATLAEAALAMPVPPAPPVDSSAPEAAVADAAALATTDSSAPAEAAPPSPPESPAAAPAIPEAAPTALPEMPAAAPAGESGKTLDQQYLEAILADSKGAAAAEQVQQRISYPDDLYGGALVRSQDKPGQVTMFYPLRSVGGVTVKVGRDKDTYAISLDPVAQVQVDTIMGCLKRYMREGEACAWYPNRNMLEITASEDSLPFIKDMLEFLDTPLKQIIIEASIWEVTDAEDTQLGARVNVAKRDGSGAFFEMFDSRFDTQAFIDTLTSGQPFQGSTLEFLTAADANHARMNVVFQFLKNHRYADLVSQPRLRVAEGHTARILTGEQVPYLTPVKLVSGRLEIATTYRDVGVQLFVTPMVAGRDMITLHVLPIVSEVIGYTPPGPDGLANPIFATREAQTFVTVANKELITIGGLNQTKKTVTESKIPILGDIPVLGYLFKSKRDTSQKVQLWFTVQPTIAGQESRIVVPELTGLPMVR